ncbi:MAG: sigma-70 family RNA polymerase sigma factor [Chloroflexi bacterium]|nr:sigma-70 family RNA polymerase sigma factor [Chloroflexota bacterium]
MPGATSSRPSNEADLTGERSDAELVRVALADRDAFAALYERYLDRVYDYVRGSVGNREDAEDVTSRTFALAIEKLGAFRGPSFAAWLFAIARNARMSHLRRPATIPLPEGRDALADPSPDPLTQILESEAATIVMRLVDELPADEQELLTLRVAGHLTNAEIGLVVGKREGAVRVQIHRIIRALQARYRAAMDELERST